MALVIRPFSGYVVDNFPRRGVLIVCNFIFFPLAAALGFITFAFVHNRFGYFVSAFIIEMGNGHMYPAFQDMFINLAPNSQRGTANPSILTAWAAGVSLGVLAGGLFSERHGYH